MKENLEHRDGTKQKGYPTKRSESRRPKGSRPGPQSGSGKRREQEKGSRPGAGPRRDQSFSSRGRPSSYEPRLRDRPERPARAPQPVPDPIIPRQFEAGTGLPDRLEGRNPIIEAIKAGRAINKLWVAKPAENKKMDPGLARLVAMAKEAGAVIMDVDKRVLDAMTTTHGHQGVIAQVAAHEYIELDDLIESIKAKEEQPFLLILAELQESYNLGSVLRIADAAGVHGVIIPMRRSVGLDAAVAKASAGAIEHVPVARVGNLSQAITKLKESGFWIAGADADGKTDYRDADWSGSLAILIGSEGKGLSPIMRRHCDFLISIPMHGKVNSLNAAIAAGIITFEAAAHRQGGRKPTFTETRDQDKPELIE
ncbi:MAG: 23S rRNA (guanosine(2251)-2'-O)-methyltransferase RlmB [Saccharofermentanales bacterium]|jgi:23S rRNA (guanosine2251-2'-O)-methyltransferase|nr:23S rRNA (guanosine(2251)-2'-O)-methyltransferase RlmB [Clostridiaceae bacterium]